MNNNDPTPPFRYRDVFACVAVIAFMLYWSQDYRGPVAKRAKDCAAAIAAYRELSESFSVVGNAGYHRQLESIYIDYGFRYDAARERRLVNELMQQDANE